MLEPIGEALRASGRLERTAVRDLGRDREQLTLHGLEDSGTGMADQRFEAPDGLVEPDQRPPERVAVRVAVANGSRTSRRRDARDTR